MNDSVELSIGGPRLGNEPLVLTRGSIKPLRFRHASSISADFPRQPSPFCTGGQNQYPVSRRSVALRLIPGGPHQPFPLRDPRRVSRAEKESLSPLPRWQDCSPSIWRQLEVWVFVAGAEGVRGLLVVSAGHRDDLWFSVG